MSVFGLAMPNQIIFGPGASAGLGRLAATYGVRALVVTGENQGRHQSVIDQLGPVGVATTLFAIGHEPTVDELRAGASVARDADCDLVVSIGGGSALDTGKAIGALLRNDGDVVDYLEVIGGGKQLVAAPVPHIAVPTTAGTGSEATKNAVVLSEEHGVKVSMRSPMMVPTVALVDPELTYSTPSSVTVSSGLDALTHLLEAYVSAKANPLVDPLCEDGLSRAARSLRRAAASGEDEAARLDMSLASLYGGIALANAGLGAVHGFAGVLGGRFHIPHGLACGCLLAPVFGENVAVAESIGGQVLERFRHVAHLLTGDPEATTGDAVAWLSALSDALEVPGLRAYGLVADLFPGVCADAARSSSMKGNPVPLEPAVLESILEQSV